MQANEWGFLETGFKQVVLPDHVETERGEGKSAYVSVYACACVYVRACVNKFFYKPGRAEAATDISPAFAYSWLNLHLAMQMYANIISEHFKNRNQHSKRHCAS